MGITIANAAGTATNFAADIIVGNTFMYRLTTSLVKGVHTLRIRDNKKRVVAKVTSTKGEIFSQDYIWSWTMSETRKLVN